MSSRPLTVDCPDCENQLTIPRAPTDRLPDGGARQLRGFEAACGECGSDLDLYYLD